MNLLKELNLFYLLLETLPVKHRIVICKQKKKSLADSHCKKLTDEGFKGLCECDASTDNRAAHCAKDNEDGRCDSAFTVVIYYIRVTVMELVLQSVSSFFPWQNLLTFQLPVDVCLCPQA